MSKGTTFHSRFGDTVVRIQIFRQKAVKHAWHSGTLYVFLNGAVNPITVDFGYWKICSFDLSMELGGGKVL
jgi:hypothetical protein